MNELGYEILPHLPYSPDLLPIDYHFFKHLNNFLQGIGFHNQQAAGNAFQEFIKSRSMDFYATGISKHFSLVKICVSAFSGLLESIFCLLLVMEAFSLQKVVEMLEEVVVSWQEVR